MLVRGESLQIDAVDQRIIALLVADARSSYAEIGAKVALSAPAVKRRVDRLRSSGVITPGPNESEIVFPASRSASIFRSSSAWLAGNFVSSITRPASRMPKPASRSLAISV